MPRSGKGFNFVSEKLVFGRAASRFGEPRSSFWEGFNFVSAKPPLRRAESRFVEPRSSRQGSTDWYFLRRAKSTAKTRRGLRPSGLRGAIQISARYMAFAKVTGVHQVTGHAENCNLSRYRRRGFESVRKESRSADARLLTFEKGMLYCKLTVGFRG